MLKRRGSLVVLAGCDRHRIYACVQALGPDVPSVLFDLSESTHAVHVVDIAVSHFGGLDGLINGAGGGGGTSGTIGSMSVSALENLLAVGGWRAADKETQRLLLEEGDRGGFTGLDPDEVLQLDCTLLTGIDAAWRAASEGRYGLSVQSELLSAIRAEGHPRKTTWRLFGTRVGWVGNDGWIDASGLDYRSDGPAGHLPWVPGTLPTVSTGRTYEVLFLFYKVFDECTGDDG